MMPRNLVLVRHGLSEANVAVKASRDGDDLLRKELFLNKHDSLSRLTDIGIMQAKISGEWLRKEFPNGFLRYYSSEYLRAMETAANLELPGAVWYTDFNLRERSTGILNLFSLDDIYEKNSEWVHFRKTEPMYWVPIGGESLADLCLRLRNVLDTLHRECSGGDVIIVCHGLVMWAFRIIIERITQERFKVLDASKDPKDRMNNGQVIQYSSINPTTGDDTPHYNWMRSVCPNNMEMSRNIWEPVARPRFTNEELLERVNSIPRIIE